MNVRSSPEQDRLIRRAAAATHRSVSEFVLESATDRAARVLADRRWFDLDGEAFGRFRAMLDRPTVFKPRLAASLAADDPFID
jgi:uncharacterized protein (DUF1778 family)